MSSVPPGLVTLKLRDNAALYNAYMPFLKQGGMFVPTAQRYMLGDEVAMVITLESEAEKLSAVGKVVWITPPGAQGNRTAGIGVHFNESEANEAVRLRIENLLAGMTASDRPTQTM